MSIVELSFLLWLTLIFQWGFNCIGSLNIAGVREKLDFVCALDAMIRKLISMMCFDIFQSKWYRNTLICEPDDKTTSRRRLLWQTLHVWLKNVKTDQRYQFYLLQRPRHTQNPTSYVFLQMFKEPLQLNSHWKMSKQIKDISFTYYGVQGTHKIQLLTYSCNVQGAFGVKLSLKNVKTDQRYQFYLLWRPRHTQNPTSYVFLQCSRSFWS